MPFGQVKAEGGFSRLFAASLTIRARGVQMRVCNGLYLHDQLGKWRFLVTFCIMNTKNRGIYLFFFAQFTLWACPLLAKDPVTANFVIEKDHSSIEFKVKYFINKVHGYFGSFSGHIAFSPQDASRNKASVTIQADSIDTMHPARNDHLKSGDFLAAAKYKEIEFSTSEWVPTGPNQYRVKGLLTILGQSQTVELDVTYFGEIENFEGRRIAGWEGQGRINRFDFGMNYAYPDLAPEVDIEISVQGVRQPD